MKNIITTTILSIALIGCGGEDGGGSNLSSENQKNGIYINKEDLTFMIVDTDLPLESVVIGDYYDGSATLNDSHIETTEGITAHGFRYTSLDGFFYDPNISLNLTFFDRGVGVFGQLESDNLIYSMERAPASLPMSRLIGTHINTEENLIATLREDGSFTIYGLCTFEGTVRRVKGYFYGTNVSATGCTNPAWENNNYTARLITVTDAGYYAIAGILTNSTTAFWGTAEL